MALGPIDAMGQGSTPTGGNAHLLLTHERLLAIRLHILAWIRFSVAGGIVVSAVVGRYVVGIERLDVRGLTLLACLLALFNIAAFSIARRYRNLEQTPESYRFLQGVTHANIAVDFLFLTVGLWLVGGAKSPFQAFYLLHVMLAGILLSPRAAYGHAMVGYTLFSALVLGQWFGLIPAQMPIGVVNSDRPLDGRFILTVLAVNAFLMTLTVFLTTGLAHLLRQGEHQLRESNEKLERLSAMHRDFLHITLHDLKSPLSAALMLLNTLKVTADPPLAEPQARSLDRARLRLDEVRFLLRDFEVLVALDTVDVEKQAKEIDTAALLQNVVEENQDLAQMHRHSLRAVLEPDLPRVHGIDRLIHEAVANLITNALKYTPDGGTVTVRGKRAGDTLRIEVEDNGIGIAPEDQARLFQEYVRIRRKDSPAGKVAGSGLGLSIVKRIVETHGGHVGITSELNKGSTFYIELPLPQALPGPALSPEK